ncbi:MAG: Uncharacterised protein [Opitutia bacterium UBA7350]|nr:MAG: Uncharacterised protein [Opitutae bacterium UBA7350]
MRYLLLTAAVFLMVACQTTQNTEILNARPFIGMTEEAWLKTTHSAILMEMDQNKVIYKANEDLYYFIEGKLTKMIASEQ